MNRPITIHHVETKGDEPEHLKITVDDHEVWRAYADSMKDNDWVMVVRGVTTAVGSVVQYLDKVTPQ